MTTLNEAMNEFKLACEADSLSADTIKQYRSIIGNYISVVDGETSITDVTRRDMRLYIVEKLQGSDKRYTDGKNRPTIEGGLSRDSVATHVTVLHRFWNWVADEYSIPNPMKGIKRPKRSIPQPKAITSNDFVKLFNATMDTDAGIRDRAILALFVDTGARLSGVTQLKADDIRDGSKQARVVEKGQAGLIYWTDETQFMAEQWLAVRNSENEYLFTSMNHPENALTKGGMGEIFKRLKKRSGVEGRSNPHSFRHNFAREYLRNGGSIVILSKLLRHKSVDVTANQYGVFSQHELADEHSKYTPIETMLERVK